MARVGYFNYEKADEQTKAAYEAQKKASGGYVTNMKRTLLQSLPSYNALMTWFPLREEILKFINKREFAILCHAISTEGDCLLCSLYFRKEFKELEIDLTTVEFTKREKLLETYGRQIVRNANNIDDNIFNELKLYFSEKEIITLTTFATIMIATNIFNKALQINIDDNLGNYVNEKGEL